MPSKPLTFGAVGDIMFTYGVGEAMRTHGLLWPFEPMLPALRRADLLFGNMESVLMPPDYPEDQADPHALASKLDGTPALRQAGFDFMNLAQNHVLDAGTISMFHTRDALARVGIASGGVGHTQAQARQLQVIEKQGLTFGFLCYAEDTNYTLGTTGPCHAYYTREAVLEDVCRHRSSVDVLVVSIHADLEFMETPSVPRRDLFREIARAGATLVLGHHPHVPQGIERLGRSLIAYSLGNFIFAAHSFEYMKRHAPETDHTFLLLVDVDQNGVQSFERIPGRIRSLQEERPVPLEGDEKRAMLAYFDRLDRMALDDAQVARAWRQKALAHMEQYLQRLQGCSTGDLLHEMLGRLLLTQENRTWVDEVMNAVRENWAVQARSDTTLHRPHYLITHRNASTATVDPSKSF